MPGAVLGAGAPALKALPMDRGAASEGGPRKMGKDH